MRAQLSGFIAPKWVSYGWFEWLTFRTDFWGVWISTEKVWEECWVLITACSCIIFRFFFNWQTSGTPCNLCKMKIFLVQVVKQCLASWINTTRAEEIKFWVSSNVTSRDFWGFSALAHLKCLCFNQNELFPVCWNNNNITSTIIKPRKLQSEPPISSHITGAFYAPILLPRWTPKVNPVKNIHPWSGGSYFYYEFYCSRHTL